MTRRPDSLDDALFETAWPYAQAAAIGQAHLRVLRAALGEFARKRPDVVELRAFEGCAAAGLVLIDQALAGRSKPEEQGPTRPTLTVIKGDA